MPASLQTTLELHQTCLRLVMARQLDAFFDLNRTFSKIRMDGDVSDDTDLSSRHGRRGIYTGQICSTIAEWCSSRRQVQVRRLKSGM